MRHDQFVETQVGNLYDKLHLPFKNIKYTDETNSNG